MPNCINTISQLKEINPDYFIICNETSVHIKYLQLLNKNFSHKIILVEKPLSKKVFKLNKDNNNKIFVAYNLRFNQIIIDLKKIVNNRFFWYANIQCHSFLPDWRNVDYRLTYSSDKSKGGGVLMDLSHEIDYAYFLFGDIKPKISFNKKISNLKIKSDDILFLIANSKKVKNIFMSLNYFSKYIERKIYLYGDNLQIEADLLNRYIKIIKGKKTIFKKYKDGISDSYTTMHKNIFNKKYNKFCTFEDSMNQTKIFKKIEKNKI